MGDVGDNALARDDIEILVVPEPAVDPEQSDVSAELNGWGTMVLTYPDGPHNCESILVDPVTDDLLVITKDGGGDTAVFRKPGPHQDGDVFELLHVVDLDFSSSPFSGNRNTTAADIHPDGDLLAIRTYSDVWLFRRNLTEDWTTTFAREPCDGDAPQEQQGEAVAFSADGSGYIVLSEGTSRPIQYRPIVPVPGG